MKETFLKLVENQYKQVKFNVSLNETIDWIKLNNQLQNVSLYTTKYNQVKVTDLFGEPETNGGPHMDQLVKTLSIVLNKFPDFQTTLLFYKYDQLEPCLYNYPIFSLSNIPSHDVYNPLVFGDYLNKIQNISEQSKLQSLFNAKKKIAYSRLGLSGIHSYLINFDNWINHYKIKFSLFSHMFPDKCDIKLFCNEEWLRKVHLGSIKEMIEKLPIFDNEVKDLYTMWKKQFDVQINIISEGNCSISNGRFLLSLYNDGHIIRIGPTLYISQLEMMVNSCTEYQLINAVANDVDTSFIKQIDQLIDNNHQLQQKNHIVNSYFSKENLTDIVHQSFVLYNQHIIL